MISTLWASIVSLMTGLGWKLDASETDSLMERHYTIQLPGNERWQNGSTWAKTRVKRDIRIRLQFRERKDTHFEKLVAEEVEKVATTLRDVLLYERDSSITREGGKIAEIAFSTDDEMS